MPTPLDILPDLGRYRIVKKLGEGGMGAVYLAEDRQLGRRVALKVPLFDSPEAVQRFEREARVAAAVDHVNICPVLDIGESQGVRYLTMPFIEGVAFKDLIDPDKPLPPEQVAAWVRTMAGAMQVLHDRGMIHRDLKPHNVMLKHGRDPVIMDFGLARACEESAKQLTASGAVLGTPAYMSPEQINGDTATIGPPTDIYSLGVILYEALTGRLPFDAPSIAAMLAQVFLSTPPPPSSVRPDLDPTLDAICARAMAKKVANRYASMAEFAAALEPLAAPLPTASLQATLPALRRPETATLHSAAMGQGTAIAAPPVPGSASSVPAVPPPLPRPAKPARSRGVLLSLVGAGMVVLAGLAVASWLLVGRQTREATAPAPVPSGTEAVEKETPDEPEPGSAKSPAGARKAGHAPVKKKKPPPPKKKTDAAPREERRTCLPDVLPASAVTRAAAVIGDVRLQATLL